MNKITKYITTGAAAMLMLMSVGAVQTNVNAARHYRARVSRSAKKTVRHNNKRKTNNKNNSNSNQCNNKQAAKAKIQRMGKQEKQAVKNTAQHTRKNAVKKSLKKNKRYFRRANQMKQRRNRKHGVKVLKAHYRVVPMKFRNKRARNYWNRALKQSNFVDGYDVGISEALHGYRVNNVNYIFSKYAPNDKRAVIPSYMNPNAKKVNQISNYHSINNDLWFQGYFSSTNASKNTKNPKAYVYTPQVHGWVLLKR